MFAYRVVGFNVKDQRLNFMNTGLKTFIAQYADFSHTELEDISDAFRLKAVRKNDYLFSEGDICRDLVFVQKGCLRLYYLEDGVEISVWFAFEQSSAIEIYNFVGEQPIVAQH